MSKYECVIWHIWSKELFNLEKRVDCPAVTWHKAYVLGNAPTYELCSIESALYILHCSRRQLQRVLSKLCQEGFLLRTGKGHYRLNTV